MTMMLLPRQHDSVDQGNGQVKVCLDDRVAASSFAVGVRVPRKENALG
jgi:hypothetical protein